MKGVFYGVCVVLSCLLVVVAGGSVLAAAQKDSTKAPLEITAQESLEWFRNEKFFRAVKDVIAKQGDTTLKAQRLTARYEETAQKNIDIRIIEAEGGVTISTRDSTAHGDSATYDVQRSFAVMKGRNLRLTSPDQTVTAQESFEYAVNKGELAAAGRAKVVRAGDTLEADRIEAVFTEDAKGKRVIKTLEAIGDVVITTPTEVLTGARALYSAQTNTAEITGGVKITRGPNILEGERAEVDLATKISRMFGAPEAGGRVRGVFYPGSDGLPKP